MLLAIWLIFRLPERESGIRDAWAQRLTIEEKRGRNPMARILLGSRAKSTAKPKAKTLAGELGALQTALADWDGEALLLHARRVQRLLPPGAERALGVSNGALALGSLEAQVCSALERWPCLRRAGRRALRHAALVEDASRFDSIASLHLLLSQAEWQRGVSHGVLRFWPRLILRRNARRAAVHERAAWEVATSIPEPLRRHMESLKI